MLRRLVALLALITGLAAYAVPAQAWGDANASRTVATAKSSGSEASAECDEAIRSERETSPSTMARKVAPAQKAVVVKVPSVLFGADRAFE